jgi:membrane protease YdiL (CAAX protease family)
MSDFAPQGRTDYDAEDAASGPFTRRQALTLWLLATAPMAFVTWVVAPLLIPRTTMPVAVLYLILSSLGLLWQCGLALWVLRREQGGLTCAGIRRRTWLNSPRHPKTGAPRWSRLGWLIPILALVLPTLLVATLFTSSWMALRPLRAWGLIPLTPGFTKGVGLASPELAGQWWVLGLVALWWVLSAALGEELLFRGVLLPRMSGTFGRRGWFANATLFALYHLHVPLLIPFRWLAALPMAWAARRYRSSWFAIAVRGVEGLGLVALALTGILSARFAPLSREPQWPSVERQPAADTIEVHALRSLPPCDLEHQLPFGSDMRSADLSALDGPLDLEKLDCRAFDTRTTWPVAERMPAGFNPTHVMKLGASPGLGVRTLHAAGVTGRNVGIGVIDLLPLVTHAEYARQLRWYEELHGARPFIPAEIEARLPAHMHGTAVASIAVGATTGVAPEADLYFIGMSMDDPKVFFLDTYYLARGIRRFVELNRVLPDDRRIRVVSISMGWGNECPGYASVAAALREATAAGIAVFAVTADSPIEGLGRSPLRDPDRFDSYEPPCFWTAEFFAGRLKPDRIFVPMDARTAASPTGPNDYAFYRGGGLSWTIPYVAGVYALAVQVDPTLTRERFVALARTTGRTTSVMHGGRAYALGPIIDPTALIAVLQARKH